MGIGLNSNIGAMQVARALDRATATLQKSSERLASGLRINRASDDAAGLSISSQLGVQSRVLNRAKLNINDGMSAIQIADGALESYSSLVLRMTELAQQAANGTISRTQRSSLNLEYQALQREVIRIGAGTNFNGLKLLDGQKSSRSAQTAFSIDPADTIVSAATSADGRYAVVRETFGAYLTIFDEMTGSTKRLDVPGSSGSFVGSMQVLTNGDVFFAVNDTGTDIYRYSTRNGTLSKLTNSRSLSDGTSFAVSQDGTMLAFAAATVYADNQPVSSAVTSGPPRFYALDLTTGLVRAGTFVGGPTSPTVTISADGNYMAATRPDTSQVYVSSTRGTTLVSTNVSASSAGLYGVTDSGEVIMRSTANLTGENPLLVNQIFSFQIGVGTITQRSNFTSNFTFTGSTLDLSTLYLRSTLNFTGENPNANLQIFEYSLSEKKFVQKTNFTNQLSGLTHRAISADGSRYYVSSGSQMQALDITPEASSLNIEAGYGADGMISASLASTYSAIRGLGAYSIAWAGGAQSALERMRDNQKQIALARGNLGVGISRLEVAALISDSQSSEFTAAQSRITSADIAEESSNVVRSQILQQAGVAILAQVKQQPALALRLLQK